MDPTDLASDDDELSHLNPRARRSHRPRTQAPVLVPKQTTRQSTAKKTYRRRCSDKENQSHEEATDEEESALVPLPDDTFDDDTLGVPVASTDELKKAARKFKEVDKWELEFEEVTESSSPQDAR
ncbi:ATP-dependent RNA helicase MRH4, mitochondrial [Ophiocordyceps camponoti-floridani]|uniref:ATP-dependent RNA helicase MRH4, mitochondrial n=1 Tax=Ophiocordyceps camponoti-floridani TaxID=2030778 RepID=A0A8H4VAU8_9HYPO|nr:ATP-dependent RNA helicase MRH4, mitochondrial [Ophiocordyceps camponoti-floridani]